MAYTDEQKKIVALCRKYKGVICKFDELLKDRFHIHCGRNYLPVYSNKMADIDNVRSWLDAYATLKQVGRPKGWRKENPKKTAKVTLTPEQWQVIEKIQAENGFKYHSQAIAMCIDFYNNQNN